jgi:tetratricopeptide (TPR) repeat protein
LLAQEQTVESLVNEAQILFLERRPLDARVKLQEALKLDPNDYRPHFYLGVYYLSEVGHFQLADKYLTQSEELFRKVHGSDLDGTIQQEAWKQNAKIIQFRSEARLNLDDYKGALRLVERFERTYWDSWVPGSKAWILMKLRRVDEAIEAAQSGLLRGADSTRTYNILGILYSLKGNRNLALKSFAQAIRAELALGSMGQAATPLNNSGEVYRELFQEDLAEGSWIRALSLADGCDHILPSLNLAILYIDELKLFQAERALKDFEACFAQKSIKTDTEHRALLALARGKILLHQGEITKALPLLEQAADREQFYGKIGTTAEDIRVAAAQALSLAYEAAREYERDRPLKSIAEWARARGAIISLGLKSSWQARKGRKVAISKLEDFEDLFIRNTDSMLEYPSLGQLFRGAPRGWTLARIRREMENDSRPEAAAFYELYQLEREVESERLFGVSKATVKRLTQLLSKIRERDRLLRARALSLLILSLESAFSLSSEEEIYYRSLREQLFELLPAQLRQIGSSLPVSVTVSGTDEAKKLARELTRYRFHNDPGASRFSLKVETDDGIGGRTEIGLTLLDFNRVVVSLRDTVTESDKQRLLSEFLDKVFGYRADAQ